MPSNRGNLQQVNLIVVKKIFLIVVGIKCKFKKIFSNQVILIVVT
jgi:hypothetical protein